MFKKYKLIDETLKFPPVVEAFKIAEIEDYEGDVVDLRAAINEHFIAVKSSWVELNSVVVGGYYFKINNSLPAGFLNPVYFEKIYTLVDDEEINGDINAEIEETGEGTIDNGVVDYEDESGMKSLTPVDLNHPLNLLANEIHAGCVAKGWWDDMNRCLFQTLQLVITEIAEATEGARKNMMDDHLPHRKMEEVELADAMIRLLDLAGRYGWIYDANAIGDRKSFDEITSVAGRHFICTRAVIYLGTACQFNDEPAAINLCYSEAMNYLLYVAELQSYDVMTALHEKVAYNQTRADHTREARAAENGKKF